MNNLRIRRPWRQQCGRVRRCVIRECCHFWDSPRLWVAQSITGGLLRYLLLFALIVGLFFLLSLFIIMLGKWGGIWDFSLVDFDSDRPFWSHVRGLCYLFLDPGYLYYHAKEPWFAEIAGLLVALGGMLFVNGLLISMIVNFVTQQREKVLGGHITYKRVRQHGVMIGFGEIGMSVLLQMLGERPALSHVLIHTQQDVEHLRSLVRSQLSADEYQRVIFYAGKFDSMEELRKLNLPQARLVYVLGEQGARARDAKNIQCLYHISAILKEFFPETSQARPCEAALENFIRIRVQFEKIISSAMSQKLNSLAQVFDSLKDYDVHIDIQSFNFYENWARMLWSSHAQWDEAAGYLPLDQGKLDGSNQVHLVIIGFTSMGQALLLEALRVCHYLHRQHKTRITVIDPMMEQLKPVFRARYPHVESLIHDIELEFLDEMAESPEARELIDEAARDEHRLLTVAVCLQDADSSLAIGLNLPESVYYLPHLVKATPQAEGESKTTISNQMTTQILIRQELYGGAAEIVENNVGFYKNVKVFGMLDEVMPQTILDDRIAIFVNEQYNNLVENSDYHNKADLKVLQSCWEAWEKEWSKDEKVTRKSWKGIGELVRWSNRYQVDLYDYYMRCYREANVVDLESLHREIVTNTTTGGSEKDATLIERLAHVEHRRWMAERAVAGLRQKREGEERFNEMFIHSTMIAGEQLDPDNKRKDRDAVINAFIICKVMEELAAQKEVPLS